MRKGKTERLSIFPNVTQVLERGIQEWLFLFFVWYKLFMLGGPFFLETRSVMCIYMSMYISFKNDSEFFIASCNVWTSFTLSHLVCAGALAWDTI